MSSKLQFVIFFVESTPGAGEKYYPLLEMAISSIRKTVPFSDMYILTDQSSHIPFADALIRMDLEYQSGITRNKLLAYARYVQQHARPDSHIIFTEPDILVQRDPSCFFHNDFDIGLFFREHSKPIQAGVILVSAGSCLAADRFFCDAMAMVDESQGASWFDDSIILREWAHGLPLTESAYVAEHRGIRTRMIPCSPKSHTYPKYKNQWCGSIHPQAVFMHFKGNGRKSYMTQYYQSWMGQ